jgi:hypothetical protein
MKTKYDSGCRLWERIIVIQCNYQLVPRLGPRADTHEHADTKLMQVLAPPYARTLEIQSDSSKKDSELF